MDAADQSNRGFAGIGGGRMINPPFLFGSGGIELLGKEMTADLQNIKEQALRNPGRSYDLKSKGVAFGRIRVDSNGRLDLSRIEGVDEDLVVKPFGRKGDFPTVRAFDVAAFEFHMGLQPVEMENVGWDHDEDNDGVKNEILPGELSAMHIHNILLPPPKADSLAWNQEGFELFKKLDVKAVTELS